MASGLVPGTVAGPRVHHGDGRRVGGVLRGRLEPITGRGEQASLRGGSGPRAHHGAERSPGEIGHRRAMRPVLARLRIINTKNCSLSIVLTATDQKPQKSLKR